VVLTVALSWTMVTLVSPCDTPHLHYGSPTEGIAFGVPPYARAFTIGMTYQVSDTDVRDSRIRRNVLSHAS